jgi:Sec-independent protein translocase protein TatA
VAGAIGVAGPEERMRKSDLERTIKALRNAAARIEAKLKTSAAEAEVEETPKPARRKKTATKRSG